MRELRPVMFELGPLSVHAYGFMLALAFLAAIVIGRWHLKSRFIDQYAIYDIVLAGAAGGILGARVFYVIGNWNEFSAAPLEILEFWNVAGLVFYGGLLGGALAVLGVIRWKKLPFWTIADTAGMGLALGLAIARVGCFLNGCCYGEATGLPWGVSFPEETRWRLGILEHVHPTQIYELLADLALFVFLITFRRRQEREGELFLLFLAGYGAIRFFVEFFRAHDHAQAAFGFQLLSIAVFLAGGLGFIFRRRLIPEAG
ncbi:MAG: prolipoprotein diacylglyceryl transferase [Candidatus Geothermincolia bacterium]